uniref:Secreted protein n=1 Tax=Anopheles merus TaxID=30066 RepID=A0A182VB99_ANOME
MLLPLLLLLLLLLLRSPPSDNNRFPSNARASDGSCGVLPSRHHRPTTGSRHKLVDAIATAATVAAAAAVAINDSISQHALVVVSHLAKGRLLRCCNCGSQSSDSELVL